MLIHLKTVQFIICVSDVSIVISMFKIGGEKIFHLYLQPVFKRFIIHWKVPKIINDSDNGGAIALM